MSNNLNGNHDCAVAQVTIRAAGAADGDALRRLAELDSARVPEAPVLVAEVAGQMRAAISIPDGAVVADPFHPTKEVIDMIRIHAHAPNSRAFGRQRPAPSSPSIPGFPVIPARS
jgi:hypothetical protein